MSVERLQRDLQQYHMYATHAFLQRLVDENTSVTPLQAASCFARNDLKVIAQPRLSAALNIEKKLLRGTFLLQVGVCVAFASFECLQQVEALRDIGVALEQREKQQDTAARVLKLTLTDGHMDVGAFENGRVPSLSVQTKVGEKVCLTLTYVFIFSPSNVNSVACS